MLYVPFHRGAEGDAGGEFLLHLMHASASLKVKVVLEGGVASAVDIRYSYDSTGWWSGW